jgi:hypothetical protein
MTRTITWTVAAALIALLAGGCAAPYAPRQERDAARQDELTQMERAGQRNDDRPVRVQ